MLVQEINNHVAQALARLLQQYVNRPRIASIISSLVQQIQNLENAAYSINQGRQLFDGTTYPAVGEQLDELGTLVNVSRNGLPDSEYLVFILGTIAEDYSDGTRAAVTNIINTFFMQSMLITMDNYPAEFDFEVAGSMLDPSLLPAVVNIIQNSLGGGIKLGFIATIDPTNGFTFSDALNQITPRPGNGFDDATAPGGGGVWASAIFTNAGD
jgi:hypothetical protein